MTNRREFLQGLVTLIAFLGTGTALPKLGSGPAPTEGVLSLMPADALPGDLAILFEAKKGRAVVRWKIITDNFSGEAWNELWTGSTESKEEISHTCVYRGVNSDVPFSFDQQIMPTFISEEILLA